MKDLDIIKQIEKKLKVELRKIDERDYLSNGYTLNQNG